jgi:hypothetical protein
VGVNPVRLANRSFHPAGVVILNLTLLLPWVCGAPTRRVALPPPQVPFEVRVSMLLNISGQSAVGVTVGVGVQLGVGVAVGVGVGAPLRVKQPRV